MIRRRKLLAGLTVALAARGAWANDADFYLAGPDFLPFSGPGGTFRHAVLEDSRIFPGYRHWWGIYTPAPQVTAGPPALMVFQDGASFANLNGPWRVPTVLDNLIAQKAVPPMVAVFVSPGALPQMPGEPRRRDDERSVEYDTLSPRYGDFLLQEILPLARAHATWTDNPNAHGIAGHSSGGICAFTVAWNRPDQFTKVYSANGSFTNIRGGNQYPSIIRAEPKRPLRIYQWSDIHDLSRPDWGNWATANQAMAAAFDAAGYDHRFDFGEGSHNPKFAAARFPDAMRWLWRGVAR